MMKTISMRLTLLTLLMSVSVLFLSSCKNDVKDSDLQAAITEKTQSIPGASSITASVKDGVVTLTGEVTDVTAKTAYESAVKNITGVKEVVNNVTVATPQPAQEPVTISPDETLQHAVNEVIKAYNGVKADVKEGVVTLNGEIKKAELTVLMPALHALKPKKIENKLTVKK
ncbi:MAG: BON domain-containing protein [Niastella sp.]|nr:BON domain-containing protein [Niastella sp.]